MKTQFLSAGDFSCHLTVEPTSRPADTYSLRVSSRWLSAKDPLAEQTKLHLTVDRPALEALHGAIGSALKV